MSASAGERPGRRRSWSPGGSTTARPGSPPVAAPTPAPDPRAPGFLDYRVHPPTYNDNECVITYRFADPAWLDRCIVSPRRRRHRAERRVHRAAESSASSSRAVTAHLVSSVRVRPGGKTRTRVHGQGSRRPKARRAGPQRTYPSDPPRPGPHGGDLDLRRPSRPGSVGGLPTTALRPRRHDGADRRSAHPERRPGLRRLVRRRQPPPARRWKQAIAVIAGLIPVTLLVTLARQALAPGAALSPPSPSPQSATSRR